MLLAREWNAEAGSWLFVELKAKEHPEDAKR
jgi:hypothetical protein